MPISPKLLWCAAVLSIMACHPKSAPEGTKPDDDEPSTNLQEDNATPVPLTVHNRNYLDVNIQVIRAETRYRIATVPGSSDAQLEIPGYLFSNARTIQVAANPIGSTFGTEFVSQRLVVAPGMYVVLTITPDLSQSNAAAY